MVRKIGRSGRCCGLAVDTGRSTATSTVESGAATMKMMSSTSITSMKGVTLISWFSTRSSSPLSRPPAMTARPSLGRTRQFARRHAHAAVEVARDQPQDFGRRIAQQPLVAADPARELVVDDDRGNGCEQPDGGGEQ